MTRTLSLRETLASTAGPPSLLVVSDSHIGSRLTAAYAAAADVHLVTDSDRVAAAAPDEARVTVGDVTALRTVGDVSDASAAVVALRTDRRTLLLTQLLRTRFEIDPIVVLLEDPTRREALESAANAVVCASNALSTALQDQLELTLTEAIR